MSIIYQNSVSRSLTQWCARIEQEYKSTDRISLWLFDDLDSLQIAQKNLQNKGYQLSFHCALKPLVHFFMSLENTENLRQIKVTYPVSPDAKENRFRLEAYPLAGMFPHADVAFEAGSDCDNYYVNLFFADGTMRQEKVFAPNQLAKDCFGRDMLRPCGWLRIYRNGECIRNEQVVTDLDEVFDGAMQAIRTMPLPPTMPYFEELTIRVSLPQNEKPVGYGQEIISYQEILHEELYFSTLEYYQSINGLPPEDRTVRPGQIAPLITRSKDDNCHMAIELVPLSTKNTAFAAQEPELADRPMSHSAIAAALDNIGGALLQAKSRSGRGVCARYNKGSDNAVMISGCQHGNETTGTVGALRAAHMLSFRKNAHFVISPLENPDGNALFLRSILENPHHMHHAARYTAFGNDLQNTPDSAPMERGIRIEGRKCSGAKLHVNLHGYPSHEWIRPLSGYIPHNFAMWTLPKGFFLVFRYREGWEKTTRQLAEKVTACLALNNAGLAMNDLQVKLYRQHAGEPGFETINGIPCSFALYPNATFEVELISEYPDETVYGDDFKLGHQMQMETVLAAYEAWQGLMQEQS